MSGVSRIYQQGPTEDPTGKMAEQSQERYFQSPWRTRGIAVIPVDHVIDDIHQQAVRNVATQLYGERNDKSSAES